MNEEERKAFIVLLNVILGVAAGNPLIQPGLLKKILEHLDGARGFMNIDEDEILAVMAEIDDEYSQKVKELMDES